MPPASTSTDPSGRSVASTQRTRPAARPPYSNAPSPATGRSPNTVAAICCVMAGDSSPPFFSVAERQQMTHSLARVSAT